MNSFAKSLALRYKKAMKNIDFFLPKWAASVGALHHSNARVRTQCTACGMQQRVETSALLALYGGATSLVDFTETCSIVACTGKVFFMASVSYGRQWIELSTEKYVFDEIAKPVNAMSLNLIKMSKISPKDSAGRRLVAEQRRDLSR